MMNKCFRTIVVALISIIMIGCDKNEYTDKIEEINNEKSNLEFLGLKNPKIRNIDIIWAKYLFGSDYELKLNEALRLLEFLANRRDS